MGLVANNLNCVAFLVFFGEDDEGVVDFREGGELGSVVICLLKNNINETHLKIIVSYVIVNMETSKYIKKRLHYTMLIYSSSS